MNMVQRAYLTSLVAYRKALKVADVIEIVAIDAATFPGLRGLTLALLILRGSDDFDEELLVVLGHKYGTRVLRGLEKLRGSSDQLSSKPPSSDEEDDDGFKQRISTLQSATLSSFYR
jgi:hypothetical protein